MFVRHRFPWTYTVLQSVRTAAGPRQRCIAHWRATPSLAEAIQWAKAGIAEAETPLAQYRRAAAGGTVGGTLQQQKFMRENAAGMLPEMERRHERAKARLTGLEAAHAVLGDWTDPVERPDDAAWWAKSYSDRLMERREKRRVAERSRTPEAEAEAEREHERWLESMMKMAM